MELITGGTGIVGSHLLLDRTMAGVPVRALVRPASDRSIVERIFHHYRTDAKELLSRITWVDGDLDDVGSLKEAMTGVRYVYHAAALVSFDPRDIKALKRTNQLGTANVVNAALLSGVQRLCLISSTATIGSAGIGVERTEDLPWKAGADISPYATSKYASEMEVHRGIAEGLDAVIVNPSVILGPGVKGRSSMTLIERIQGGLKFHPPGSNAVVDARDVATCASRLMEHGTCGERYLAIGENVGYRTLFAAISNAFDVPAPVHELPPWMLELAWRVERVRTLFGGRPLLTRYTVKSGIENRAWSSEKVRNITGVSFRGLDEMAANMAAFANGQKAY